jgi:hypothetical protein
VEENTEWRRQAESQGKPRMEKASKLQRRELIADSRLRMLDVKKYEKELLGSRFSADLFQVGLHDLRVQASRA